jgi:hypothetical protein
MSIVTKAFLLATFMGIGTLCVPRAAWTQASSPTCCAQVSTVLTKTMLKVKVAHLEIDVDSATAAKVQTVIGGSDSASGRVSDSIASAFMATTHADATMEFLHSVTASQFLGGQKGSFKHMVKSGLLTQTAADQIQQDTQTQFSFLNDGGIDKGDKLIMTLRGDTVVTRFVTAGGTQRTSFTRVGQDRRMAFLGEYFGPRSDFRNGLIESAVASATAAGEK